MTIDEAKGLIAPATISTSPSQQWADLGSGAGTFSYALASLLPPKSTIICIDIEMQHIDPVYNNTSLQFKKADIQRIEFPQQSLSGILMANSLHYIKEQAEYIKRLANFLEEDASWIVVEYDTDAANRWVPYPVSFNKLQTLFKAYGKITRLGERPSIYQHAAIYACQVLKR